jgi:hypothetical protein
MFGLTGKAIAGLVFVYRQFGLTGEVLLTRLASVDLLRSEDEDSE